MSLTVVIAHYRRPVNVDRIAANLPASARLFIVNNSADGPRLGAVSRRRADWVLDSSRNNLVTRWFMASQAGTSYYCVHDDDLLLEPHFYSKYIKHIESSDDSSLPLLTGPFGVRLIPGETYAGSFHTSRHGTEVDIVVGRMVFGQVQFLNKIPACPPGVDGYGFETVISEDIFVSATLSTRFGTNFKITNLGGIVELPAPYASSASMVHYQRRDMACRLLFQHFTLGNQLRPRRPAN